MNALARLEGDDILGPLPALMRDADRAQSITAQIAFLWAGLLHHHNVSMIEAGDIMDEIGLEECALKVKAAMAKAYPKLFPSDEGDDGDSPGKSKPA